MAGTLKLETKASGANNEVYIDSTTGILKNAYNNKQITLIDEDTAQTLTNKTLVTPALGTPVSGVITNCTGSPVLSAISTTNQVVYEYIASDFGLYLYKDNNNFVRMYGGISITGGIGTNVPIFTVPAGYIPSAQSVKFTVLEQISPTDYKTNIVIINYEGIAIIQSLTQNATYIFFDNVQYYLG
jgi:hypothetical protein